MRVPQVLPLAGLALLTGCAGSVPDATAPTPVAVVPRSQPAVDPPPVPQRSPAGTFPESLSWQASTLQRNGVGLCEWGLLGIDLYVAAFYAERPARSLTEVLEPDQRTLIHLHFVRSLSADQLRAAFTAATRANTGDRFGDHAAPLQLLLDAMQPVTAGDSYTFAGAPGAGLTILRNGAPAGAIDDDDFRRLFLRLYLGDRPPTKALRDGLLGVS